LSRTFLRDKDLKTSFQQLPLVLAKQKLALLIFSIANPSANRTLLSNSLATPSSCVQQQHIHIKPKKMTPKFQCYQTLTHLHFATFFVSMPLRAKTPNRQQKGKYVFLKNLKTTLCSHSKP
jgi:hypothetical protein